MNKKMILLGLAATVLAMGCDSETRKGSLSLSGSTPLTVVDEGGKTVDFTNGDLKVEFSGGSRDKFTVSLEQGGRKAKFSATVKNGTDGNFTLVGSQIGQRFDAKSVRNGKHYGEPLIRYSNRGRCEYRQEWQKYDEDWTVAFTSNGSALGTFVSAIRGEYDLIREEEMFCREGPGHDRPGPQVKADVKIPAKTAAVATLEAQVEKGLNFN